MAKRKAVFTLIKKKKPTTIRGAGPKAPTQALPYQPTYTPQALPVDPIYTEQLGLNQLGLDQTLAGIQYQQGQVGQGYGFNAQGMLDPSNPYNRATMLQRAYQQGQRGTTNSMAARGQLYAGSHQRNLDEGTFRYGRDYDSLRRAAMGEYQRLSSEEQQARFGRSQADIDARGDSLARAAGTEPVDPGPYAGIDFSALDRLIKAEKKPKKPAKPKNWVQVAPRNRRTRIG